MENITETQLDTIDIQLRIMIMLNKICGLSHDEVSEILFKTDILDTIKDCYFMLHQEGDYANMVNIKRALEVRGYTINFPSISNRKWKKWNHVCQQYNKGVIQCKSNPI